VLWSSAFHRAGWVVEFVCIANTLLWFELDIGPAEGMALADAEISERHLVRTADFRIHLVDFSGESVWWKPFRHRIRIKERPIDFLRRGA